jgi:hypothetical protein
MKADFQKAIFGTVVFDRDDTVPGRQIAVVDPDDKFDEPEQLKLAKLICEALNATSTH